MPFDPLATLGAALTLNQDLFAAVLADPVAMRGATIWVAVLAAVSIWLGQIAVLVLNRLTGWRLVASLVSSTIAIIVLNALQAAIIWLAATLILADPVPLRPLIAVALLSLAPQVFQVLTAIPHIGLGLGKVLSIWSLLVMFVGVTTVLEVRLIWGLAFTALGWGIMQGIQRIFSRQISAFTSWLWTLVTGKPTRVTSQDILSGMPLMPVNTSKGASA